MPRFLVDILSLSLSRQEVVVSSLLGKSFKMASNIENVEELCSNLEESELDVRVISALL